MDIHNKDNQPHYDYYYDQRLKYKDDPRLHKYIEFSKILDGTIFSFNDEIPCYDPETMLFTVNINSPHEYQGERQFNSFKFSFFPYYELGTSWNATYNNFLNIVFSACVNEGMKQKSERISNYIDNL